MTKFEQPKAFVPQPEDPFKWVEGDYVDNTYSLDEGVRRLKDALGEFVGDVRRRLRTKHRGAPPTRAMQITTGAGKTAVIVETIAAECSDLRFWICVPTHKLADEIASALKARGVAALHFKGRQTPLDLDDKTEDAPRQCAKHKLAERLSAAGVSVYKSMCFDEREDGDGAKCEHFDVCPYMAQFRDSAIRKDKAGNVTRPGPRVLVISSPTHFQHDRLADKFGQPDVIFIDESMAIPTDVLKLYADSAARIERRAKADFANASDDRRAALKIAGEIAAKLSALIARGAGRVTRAALKEIKFGNLLGLKYKDAERTLAKRLCSPGENVAEDALEVGLEVAREAKALVSIAREIGEFMLSGAPVSGRLTVKGGALVHTPFWPMEDRFRIPTMLFDATLPPKAAIERAIGRKVEILPPIEVRWPEPVRLVYLVGTSFSATSMGLVKSRKETGIKHYERMRSFITWASREYDRGVDSHKTHVAVFAQRGVLDGLNRAGCADGEPGWRPRSNVEMAHFGALRGLNSYKGVRAIALFGRLMPDPASVEAMAERITGVPVETSVKKWSSVERKLNHKNGRAIVVRCVEHRDPLCEALRWSICEAELIQAIGRGRAVRRTADKPLTIYVVGNMPLPFPADSIGLWDAEAPSSWLGRVEGRLLPLDRATAECFGFHISERELRRLLSDAAVAVEDGFSKAISYNNGMEPPVRASAPSDHAPWAGRLLCDMIRGTIYRRFLTLEHDDRLAEKVLGVLRDVGQAGISAANMHQRLRKLATAVQIRAVLERLQAESRADYTTVAPIGGGRATEIWRLK